MSSLTKAGATTTYAYRSDGMRVKKSGATTSEIYRYDGQMPSETVETTGATVATVQRNTMGKGHRHDQAHSRRASIDDSVTMKNESSHTERGRTPPPRSLCSWA